MGTLCRDIKFVVCICGVIHARVASLLSAFAMMLSSRIIMIIYVSLARVTALSPDTWHHNLQPTDSGFLFSLIIIYMYSLPMTDTEEVSKYVFMVFTE